MWNNLKNIVNVIKSSNAELLKNSIYNIQPFRTTFILKRRYPPGLHKTNAKPHKLRGRHYIYDLVEDTDIRKREPFEIILTSYVEGLGVKGDIVKVKPNYAYNNLILPKLGVYKTEENMKKYIQESKIQDEKPQHSSPYAPKTKKSLEYILLSVTMNKETPWTLEPWHIRTSLRKAGIHANEDCITLPEKPIKGPDLSLENKEFYVTVTINNFEKAFVRCRIHHWSTESSERLPYEYKYWEKETEAIFPEQLDILTTLRANSSPQAQTK